MTFVGVFGVVVGVAIIGIGFAATGLIVPDVPDAQSILFSSILLQPKNDDFSFLIFSFGLSVGPEFRMEFLELPSVMSA